MEIFPRNRIATPATVGALRPDPDRRARSESGPLRAAHRLVLALAASVLALIAGCAHEPPVPEGSQRPPDVVKAEIASLLPASVAARGGWATDIYAAFATLGIAPDTANVCSVLAVAAQESGFRVDPAVPGLGRIAWDEIDRRAERAGVPRLLVHAALQLSSPNGKSYAARIDAARTEKDLSDVFQDFIGLVPMGRRLFSGWNPVHTGGPMQVSIAFAEREAGARPYPYPLRGSIRDEVFTRRGGLYFGIAHLLGYPADYPDPVYRFADYNAGHYASRNAAFQRAVSVASGIPLALDGDLIRPGGDAQRPGSTEVALRTLGRRIGMSDSAIRRALEQGDEPGFDDSALSRKVFALAERFQGGPLPRAVIPKIELKSPKITRRLTTEWFAQRVDGRYRRCRAQAAAAS